MNDGVDDQIRLGLRLLADEVQPPATQLRSRGRAQAAMAIAGVAAIAAIGIYVFVPSGLRPAATGASGPQGSDVTPTMADPFPGPGPKQVPLSEAAKALEGALVLPDTAQVGPADLGEVWMNQFHGEETQTAVRVTFPSQGLIISYERPAPPDPVAYFHATTKETPNLKLIWLGATPASYYPASSDGSSWGAVELIVGGVMIDVLGRTSEASLEAVAQSIVDRATIDQTGSSGFLGPGPGLTMAQPLAPGASRVSLAEASSRLGGPVTLPDTPFVQPADAGNVFAASATTDSEVAVAVTFPAQGLIVWYERPAVADPLANYQSVVKDSPGSQVVYLRDRVPALSIAELPDGSNWGSVEFVSGASTIVVLGHYDEATLESVAQSILDRASG